MANLKEIRDLRKKQPELNLIKAMIFGAGKTGKSLLASTIARAVQIKKVYYFDLEGSITSVFSNFQDSEKTIPWLSDEEMNKVELISIPDTPDTPQAFGTILPAFTSPTTVYICDKHSKILGNKANKIETEGDLKGRDSGKGQCSVCKKEESVRFAIRELREDTAIIIDSGSQLADSMLSYESNTNNFKHLMQLYGAITPHLNNFHAIVQAAKCHVIVVSHQVDTYRDNVDPKKPPVLTGTHPLMGSAAYSSKLSKFYNYVIYSRLKNGQYQQGSSAGFQRMVNSGNRDDLAVEKLKHFDLTSLLDVEGSQREIKTNNPLGGIKVGKV